MRLIDADALEYHKQLECMGNGQYEEVKVVYECDIDNAPTIDAEPIVRCKDCMYFKKWIIDFTGDTIELNSCSYNNYGMNEDGYCNRGKRRKP